MKKSSTRRLPPLIAAVVCLAGCGVHTQPVPQAAAFAAVERPELSTVVHNQIPPRYQWNANFGYCGETSMISAGLYFGQYVSQYDARAIASPGVPQYKAKSQLLLGVNDVDAAAKMHLRTLQYDTAAEQSTSDFLAWVKRQVVMGRPVIIGVYTNEFRFYGNTNPTAGDPQYDHIVPVSKVASTHPLTDGHYYPDDVITFSDNGLWGPPTPYFFSYAFGSFQKTRQEANAQNGPVYSLSGGGKNYGIAILGVLDPGHETLPVRVDTDVNYEKPTMINGSTTRPAPMPLKLTVTVSRLIPGVTYKLYRYDSFSAVPDSAFNAHAAQASKHWTIRISSGSEFVVHEAIMSDDVAVYRAVPASGS